MTKLRNNIEVVETTKYDTLVDEVSKVEEYQMGYQPPIPKKDSSPYPFTLKSIVGIEPIQTNSVKPSVRN